MTLSSANRRNAAKYYERRGFATLAVLIISSCLLFIVLLGAHQFALTSTLKIKLIKNIRSNSSKLKSAFEFQNLNQVFNQLANIQMLNGALTTKLLPFVSSFNQAQLECPRIFERSTPNRSLRNRELSSAGIVNHRDCYLNELHIYAEKYLDKNLSANRVELTSQLNVYGYIEVTSQAKIGAAAIIYAAGDIFIQQLHSDNSRLTLISASGSITIGEIIGDLQLRLSAAGPIYVPKNYKEQAVALLPQQAGREVLALYSE